jgi:hypothetical protein
MWRELVDRYRLSGLLHTILLNILIRIVKRGHLILIWSSTRELWLPLMVVARIVPRYLLTDRALSVRCSECGWNVAMSITPSMTRN